jgi:hypothetical protein
VIVWVTVRLLVLRRIPVVVVELSGAFAAGVLTGRRRGTARVGKRAEGNFSAGIGTGTATGGSTNL